MLPQRQHDMCERQDLCFSDLPYSLNLLNSLKVLFHLGKTPLSCVYTEGQHWRFWISPEPIWFSMLVLMLILTLGVNVAIQINIFFPNVNVSVWIDSFRVWPQHMNETALFPTSLDSWIQICAWIIRPNYKRWILNLIFKWIANLFAWVIMWETISYLRH